MATILVCLFLRIIRPKVPKHGPIKGIQNLKITKSGFSFLIFLPRSIQFIGFIEFKLTSICKLSGGNELEYCVLPRRIGKPHHLPCFIKGLASSIIHSFSKNLHLIIFFNQNNLSMASGYQ